MEVSRDDKKMSEKAGRSGRLPARRLRTPDPMTGPQRRSPLIGIGRGLFALRGLDGTTIEK